jgi:PAS domain S-box-containing protein
MAGGRPVSRMTVLPGVQRLEPEAFLAALVNSSDDPIIGKTLDGRVVFWNGAAERLYGYTSDEMLGHDLAELVPADRSNELDEILAGVRSGQTLQDYHTARLRKDGTTVQVSITVSPVLGADGIAIGASTITHDLTTHHRQLADLGEAHRRADEATCTLETLQESAPIGLGFVDRRFRIVRMNKMLASLSGSSVEQLLGRTVADVVPEIWPQVEDVYRHVLDRDEAVLNVTVLGPDGAEHGGGRHWLASYYPVHLDAEIIGVGIVVVDVTEQLEAQEFRSIVMNHMAEGVITLDHLGRLTYSNDAATRMLGWTATELLGMCITDLIDGRPVDAEQPRGAGDEILDARSEGRQLRLDDQVLVCRSGLPLSVALSASPLASGAADGGVVVVFRDITEDKSERLRIRRELDALTWVGRIREALDENRLVIYSQPIVPLSGGRPSEEVLLRMVGRAGELISPGTFLGVAEKYGLITEIDQWVVRQGVLLAATGRSVGINLSAESIATLDLLEFIRAEVRSAGADPADLVFEITETALMRDIDRGHAFALGVVDLGCRLALDDFGTGYGTFTHVKKLPISFLKIDIEFVRGLVDSSANQHVVKAIVNLAQGFGCQTVAEGVEDAATLDILSEFGVDFAQGLFLGAPSPVGSGHGPREALSPAGASEPGSP